MAEDDAKVAWHADETVRGFLGWFVVPACLVTLAAVWATTEDVARADGMSRWLQALIVAVLGFYFGNADAARARRAEREAMGAKAEVERVVVAQMVMATSLQDQLADAHDLIAEFPKVRPRDKIEDAGGGT